MMVLAALPFDATALGVWVAVALVLAQFFFNWRKDRRADEGVKQAQLDKLEGRMRGEVREVNHDLISLRQETRKDVGEIYTRLNDTRETMNSVQATLVQLERTLRSVDTTVQKVAQEKVDRSEIT